MSTHEDYTTFSNAMPMQVMQLQRVIQHSKRSS